MVARVYTTTSATNLLHLALRLRGGGPPIGQFADVSDSSGLVEHSFSDIAPSWRLAAPGLCLEGKCPNRSAAVPTVSWILNHGFWDFDLMRHSGKKTCPVCSEAVILTTCGVNNCTWRFKGRKVGGTTVLVGQWKEARNTYRRLTKGRGVNWDRPLI